MSDHDDIKIEEASQDEIEDYSIKVVVVGDSGVGKSNILSRFVNNEFSSDCRATVGVELSTKTYKINGKVTKLHLWDTAGQERYKSITGSYYKGAKGALVVYDITNKESFERVDKWIKEIQEMGGKNINIVICGNKNDLEDSRQVSEEEGQDKGNNNNLLSIETSALKSTNIDEAFKKLLCQIYINFIKNDTQVNDDIFTQGETLKVETKKADEMKKKACC